MYVNPFWFGFLAGMITTIVLIVVLATHSKGGKK
jgi:hypothetical protein